MPVELSRQTRRELNIPNYNVLQAVVPEFRGPCGGVNQTVETTFETLGIVAGREPVWANNDPVHNDLLTAEFVKSGLVIQPDITKVPNGNILIASAHGWPLSDRKIAEEKGLLIIDTTCQLVTKVGRAVEKAIEQGRHVLYVGAKDHPEPRGVLGRISEESYTFIDIAKPAPILNPNVIVQRREKNGKIVEYLPAVLNQTTLSTMGVVKKIQELRDVNPEIDISNPQGICDATGNRQGDLRRSLIDKHGLFVVGSGKSHNSQELARVGEDEFGLPSHLINGPEDIDPSWFTKEMQRVVITSGASVLDHYLERVLEFFTDRSTRLTYPANAERKVKIDPISGLEIIEDRFFVGPNLTPLWERYGSKITA